MRLSLLTFTAVAAVLAFTATAGASIAVKTPVNTLQLTPQGQTSSGDTNGGSQNKLSGATNSGIILQNNAHLNGAVPSGPPNAQGGSATGFADGSVHAGTTPGVGQQGDGTDNSNGGSAGPGGGPHTADTHAIVSPRDHASGLPTGKRMHKPLAKTTTHGGLGTHTTTTAGTHGIIIEGHGLGSTGGTGGGLAAPAGGHGGDVKQATGGDDGGGDGGGDGGNAASPRDPASGNHIIIQTGNTANVNGDGHVSTSHGPVHALGPKPDDPSGPAGQATGGDDGGGDGGSHAHVDGIIPSQGLGAQSSH